MRQIIVIYIVWLFNVFCLYSQEPEILWTFDLDDSAFGNAAMGDIDGDGKPEIVFSTYRNDSTVYALNAEDGSLLWKYNTGGCNDVAPLIYDVDSDSNLEVVLPSSCVPKTFCLEGATGAVKWSVVLHGSDSPPSVADIDGDGKPEILHGNFGGYVSCLNAEDGSVLWDFAVDRNSWIQTAPLILDADGDKQPDFIVANWSFSTEHKIFCFRGSDHSMLWVSDLPDGHIYHGGAVADLDRDDKPEYVIGCYDGVLRVLNAEDGSLAWDYANPNKSYIAAPPLIADFNGDNQYEIVFFDGAVVSLLNAGGVKLWTYTPEDNSNSFRGGAVSDINNDGMNDIVFGTDSGLLIALNGATGAQLWIYDLADDFGNPDFSIDHAPLIADFNKDGKADIFIVGGHSEYPDIYKNFGRAYALSVDVPVKTEWKMFRYDVRRRGTLPLDVGTYIKDDKLEKSIYLSPNPAYDCINVTGISENTCVKIYNISGNLVLESIAEENQLQIDISVLSAGVYFVKAGKNILNFIKL